MIQVTVICAEAREALIRLKAWGVGLEFFDGISNDLKNLVVDDFLGAHDPWGNDWADLAPSTLKNRRKHGFGSAPLLRTYELLGSVGVMYDERGFTMSAGDGLPDNRAGFAQDGTGFEPARPFFPLRNGEADPPDSWLDLIDAALVKQFKELNS